jgi:hypothetical protein
MFCLAAQTLKIFIVKYHGLSTTKFLISPNSLKAFLKKFITTFELILGTAHPTAVAQE